MTVEQHKDLALGIGLKWTFGDEMLRLDLKAVGGDDANTSGLTNFSEKKRLERPKRLAWRDGMPASANVTT